MIWSSTRHNIDDDELTRSTYNNTNMNSTIRSVPPTPSQKNLFSRAFSSLFGHEPVTPASTVAKSEIVDDYSVPLNQSMRTFHNHLSQDPITPLSNKKVNWDDNEDEELYNDSDSELNETLNSIRNIRKYGNLPGTYPEKFPTPYIPRNLKLDQDSINNKEILQKYLDQTNETNNFLKELLSIQQYEKTNQRDQTAEFIKLKREYANELETSKQVYEGFHRLLFKYKSLKEQLKAIDNMKLTNTATKSVEDLKLELESCKRSLLSKTKRIEELETNLKRLTDQRDDLKTTILEYKNQNLRLKTSNEMLTNENSKLTESDQTEAILKQKNEMLEMQITQTNEMFKLQTNKLKEQIFDLQSDLNKQKSVNEYELYAKDKRIEELEKLLEFKSHSSPKKYNRTFNLDRKKSRPLSYHEPSTRILSPIRLNNLDLPKTSKYRSQVLNDENSYHRKLYNPTREFSISDISLILNNNQTEELTGFDNDRVTNRLMNKKKDTHDLSAIFASPHY